MGQMLDKVCCVENEELLYEEKYAADELQKYIASSYSIYSL